MICIIVWKFLDFPATQILREINFVESWREKTAGFAILEAVNFDFYEFLHFCEVWNLPIK